MPENVRRSGFRETRERQRRVADSHRGGLYANRHKCVECGNPGGAVEQSPGVYRTLCKECAEATDLATELIEQVGWMKDAACLDDWRFTAPFIKRAPLVKVCAGCPVWRECAKYAWRVDGWTEFDDARGSYEKHRSRDLHGILAGLMPDERVDIESEDEMVEAAWAKLWAYALTA